MSEFWISKQLNGKEESLSQTILNARFLNYWLWLSLSIHQAELQGHFDQWRK